MKIIHNSFSDIPVEEEVAVDNPPSITSPNSIVFKNGFVFRGDNFEPSTKFYYGDRNATLPQHCCFPLLSYVVDRNTALISGGVDGGGSTPRIVAMTLGSRSEGQVFLETSARITGGVRVATQGVFGFWPTDLLSPLGLHSIYLTSPLYMGPSALAQDTGGSFPQE